MADWVVQLAANPAAGAAIKTPAIKVLKQRLITRIPSLLRASLLQPDQPHRTQCRAESRPFPSDTPPFANPTLKLYERSATTDSLMQWVARTLPALPTLDVKGLIPMRISAAQQSRFIPSSRIQCAILAAAFITCTLIGTNSSAAQSSTHPAPTPSQSPSHKTHARRSVKKPEPAPVAQTPPPPPMPDWPINDKPNPASVVWNATGLRINASNSSLQQILSEVSTETGAKVEGLTGDERVFGEYGPGKARDVLSQLLQGSGYNVLLAGDIGEGAPRQIVLSPRLNGPGAAPNTAMNRPQQESDEDAPDQPEDQPPVQAPQVQNNNMRPNFGPGGPVRTPQQVMEEMQQRQILQQQQIQEQQQQPQQNPPQ
jgi:hypothetical protein